MLIIIPMAGSGSRFANAGYKEHKPLIEVNKKSLIEYAIESLRVSEDDHWIFVCRIQDEDYENKIKQKLSSIEGLSFNIIWIDRMTSGAAETAKMGYTAYEKKYGSYEGELMIANCDQYLEWDCESFLEESRKYDASVLTYNSIDPKNSFAEVVNGKVVQLVEKKPISDVALVGVHWWKNARDFLDSTNWLIKNDDGKRETYVSETYNYLLQNGFEVGAIPIEPGRYWCTGTPVDLSKFKGLIYEFNIRKPTTWVFDLDGTVFIHSHQYSNLRNRPTLAPGVLDTLNEIDSRGDTIILMSARKESSREFTNQILDDLGVPYDHLILGVSQGERVMVNDIRNENARPRSRGVNVISDMGFRLSDLE